MAGHMDHDKNADAAARTRAVKRGVLSAFRVLCSFCVLYAGAASGAGGAAGAPATGGPVTDPGAGGAPAGLQANGSIMYVRNK